MNDQEVTWDKLKYSIVETAKNVCGVTRGQKRTERDTWWWSEDAPGAVKNKKEPIRLQRINKHRRLPGERPLISACMDRDAVAVFSRRTLQRCKIGQRCYCSLIASYTAIVMRSPLVTNRRL